MSAPCAQSDRALSLHFKTLHLIYLGMPRQKAILKERKRKRGQDSVQESEDEDFDDFGNQNSQFDGDVVDSEGPLPAETENVDIDFDFGAQYTATIEDILEDDSTYHRRVPADGEQNGLPDQSIPSAETIPLLPSRNAKEAAEFLVKFAASSSAFASVPDSFLDVMLLLFADMAGIEDIPKTMDEFDKVRPLFPCFLAVGPRCRFLTLLRFLSPAVSSSDYFISCANLFRSSLPTQYL
jgi:hypothetical protein